jgi:hypothetical protein
MPQVNLLGLGQCERTKPSIQHKTAQLHLGEDNERRQQRVGDVGCRVSHDGVESQCHAHAEAEGKVQAKDWLQANVEADGHAQTSATRVEVTSPKSLEQPA